MVVGVPPGISWTIMKILLVELTVVVVTGTQWAISQGCRGGQSNSLVISLSLLRISSVPKSTNIPKQYFCL